MVDYGGLNLAFQNWQHFVAEPRAQPRTILVACVFPPWLAQIIQIFAQLSPANPEQRADYLAVDGINCREACGSRTAQDSCQDCLRLIVSCVRHGNAIDSPIFHHSAEKSITQTPRGVFQVPVPDTRDARNIFSRGKEWKPGVRSQFSDELFVVFRISSSQTMIEVQHRQLNSLLPAQSLQNPKQSYRIRAAGDANSDPLARLQHPVARHRKADSLNEVDRHSRHSLV